MGYWHVRGGSRIQAGRQTGQDLLRGGANPRIVSLKQGVWGSNPRSYRVFNFVYVMEN